MRTKETFSKQNAYNKEQYDRITVMPPKGKKAEWQEEAKRRNLSLSAFIQKAVEAYIVSKQE